MKTLLFLRRSFRVWPLAILLLVASCATQRDVATIVNDSAAASLLSELNPGSAAPQSGGSTAWQQTSAKIESFIVAHPEDKTTAAALRVRQAVLLMQNKQPNLARSAFDQAALENLTSARDRALKRLQTELLWWYRTAGDNGGIDFTTGEKAQGAITTVLADLSAPEDESVRDFLSAVRASIGIKMATDVMGETKARGYLQDAINGYAATLPAGETARWVAMQDWPPAGATFATAVSAEPRRHFRADGIIATAKKAITANAIRGAKFTDAYFQKKIAP